VTRKIIFIILICFIATIAAGVVALRLRPSVPFSIVSMDGYGGDSGFSGKGLGCSMQTWKSSDGSEIFETRVSYRTAEDAQKDFNDELKTATVIHERPDQRNHHRAIATFATGKVSLITVEGAEIRHVEASSLQSLLAFDRFDRSPFKFLYS
jgi:hypothetical protein